MNKTKFILGIVITILGGSIMLQNIISGVFYFPEEAYEDFLTVKIELQASQAPLKTSFFSAKEGQRLSVWLRYANWNIDHKNLKIAAALIDEDEDIRWELEKDLQFGSFGNSTRKIRYQKLGAHKFSKKFRGYLQYELDGTLIPVETSALVIRKSPALVLPLKQIGFFAVGIIALFVGIETMVQNYKTRVTCRPA